MGLHLSYVAARERKSGKTVFLAEYAYIHGHGDCALVGAVADKFRAGDDDGHALRVKYSDVLVVIDNRVRESFTFSDPSVDARAAAALKLQQARAALDEAVAAERRAGEAAASAKEAKSDRKAAQAALAEAEARYAELHPTAPEPEPEQKPPGDPTPAEQLAALDEPALAKVAANYGLAAADFATRADLEAAILAASAPPPK